MPAPSAACSFSCKAYIEAAATADQNSVMVTVRREVVRPAAAPESLLNTVIRMRQGAILEDAWAQNPFSTDPYILEKRARSVLCLPLLKQTRQIGVLHLENNLASHVFTPARISLLELLASQAAISLENARLYGELTMSEARWRKLFESVPVGVVMTDLNQRYVAANPAFQRMTGYSETELRRLSPTDMTHEEDRAATEAVIAAHAAGEPYERDTEKRFRRKDGGITWVEVSAFPVPIAGSAHQLGGVVVDVTERRRAAEALSAAQAELAHAARLTTLGQLTASIAHEVNQPLTGVITYGDACLRWLDRETPRLDQARSAVEQMISSARLASDVIARTRGLSKKGALERAQLDVNQLIDEVIALVRGKINAHRVSLRADLASSLPPLLGDRVQLQQVMMNLLMNGIQALSPVTGRSRDLQIRSREHENDQILGGVEDSGIGIEPENVGRLFDTFFTTKPDGTGMGLSICRSIIEQHGGRIWVTLNSAAGSTFQFTLNARNTAPA
jgi:PAS domain S-box-containing protein